MKIIEMLLKFMLGMIEMAVKLWVELTVFLLKSAWNAIAELLAGFKARQRGHRKPRYVRQPKGRKKWR